MPTAQSAQQTKNVNSSTKAKGDNKIIAKAVAKVNTNKKSTEEERRDSSTHKEQQSAAAEIQQQPPQTGSTGNKTPTDQPEFIKQSLILIEKKVRNLEKRRVTIPNLSILIISTILD
jgi:hypothetical protein